MPSATLPDDVVMNDILYPAAEIAKSFKTLERTPAPLGHPSVNGKFLSARDPEGLNQGWIGAWNENVRQEGGRVLLDKVIDVERANQSEGGKRVLAAIDAGDPVHTSTGLLAIMDAANGDVPYKFRETAATLITRLTQGEIDQARAFLADGMARGAGPRSVALDLVGRISRATGNREGGLIGLSGPYRDYVATARAELASTDPALLRNYLARNQRDRRYDRAVARAIETGKPVPPDTARTAITRYSARLVRLRGEVIARTEGLPAKHGDQIDYRFVSNLKQAAELAAYDILDAREPFSGTIPLKAHMRHLKRGDTFDIDEPGFLMDGVKCIVLSRSYDPKTAQVRLGFRSETDSKHPLALGKTTTLPAFPVLTPVDPTFVTPPLPGDWVITPRPPSGDGTQQPGFDLTGLVSNATATAVIVEWGPTADGPWTQAYAGPPDVTSIPIVGLQSGATYFIAVRYQRNSNFSDRYVYGPYVAPSMVAGVDPAIIQEKIDELSATLAGAIQQVADAQAALDQLVAQIDDGLDGVKAVQVTQGQLINGKAEQTALNFQIARIDGVSGQVATLTTAVADLPNQYASASQFGSLKSEVEAARGGGASLSARFQSLNQTIVDGLAGKASSSSVTQLAAEIANARGGEPSLSARLVVLNTASVDRDNALSSSITQVDAKAGDAQAKAVNAVSVAAAADGKASGLIANYLDVNGLIAGTYTFNNGVTSSYRVSANVFSVETPGNPADRLEFTGTTGLKIFKAGVKRIHLGFAG